MINILLVDDSNDKVANIIRALRDFSDTIFVQVVVDFVTAQQYLVQNQYDLLILDIHLPVREGEMPSFSVGRNLLSEIHRKSSIKSPYFIIKITQYSEADDVGSDIWPTIRYTPETDEWKNPLLNLVKHVLKCNLPESRPYEIKPTIFVEGKTDDKLLTEAINLFNPELLEKIFIRSERAAGASWVARQLIAWSHTLKRNADGYIKAVGLFDNDNAGKLALEEVKRVIKLDSAESKTFRSFKLSQSYAKHIIPIKRKGLDLPITLEEMLPESIWKHAKDKEWLENRTNSETLLIDPSKWNKFEVSLKEYLNTIGLSENESIYLLCFKDDCKEEIVKYILSLPIDERKIALSCFEPLIQEMVLYLFPETV